MFQKTQESKKQKVEENRMKEKVQQKVQEKTKAEQKGQEKTKVEQKRQEKKKVEQRERENEICQSSSSSLCSQTNLPLLVSIVGMGQQIYKAQIYSDGIWLNNDQFIGWNSELRVEIMHGEVKLVRGDQHLILQLLKGDEDVWNNVISPYVNLCSFQHHYTAIKKIGKGTFASVYLVKRNTDSAKFAVKAFSKEAAYSEKHGRESLLKEISIMRTVNSTNIMKLHQVYESQGSLYMIFELFQGGRLQDRIKQKNAFTHEEVQAVIKGILVGLKDLHTKGVMHRDLKPQNLLFRSEDSYDCCIGDLGLAQFVEEEEYLYNRCGTPGFVAPEIINMKDKRSRYNQQCDLFSLGLLLHLMLFKKGLFDATNCNQTLTNNKECRFDLNKVPYTQLPKPTLDLLSRLLTIDPALRITAEEALQHEYFYLPSQKRIYQEIGRSVKKQVVQCIPISNQNIPQNNRKVQKKDSCLQFQYSKETVMTGKLETVGNLGSGQRLSGFGLNLLKEVKTSKFIKDTVREEEIIERSWI